MIFQVTRTSMWDDDKPWETCIPIKITDVETRACLTPEEFDRKFGECKGKWLENGTNHRVNERGYITRDVGFIDRWGIELNSLEELMKFKEDVGEELVLGVSYDDYKTPTIEIYDDYRE